MNQKCGSRLKCKKAAQRRQFVQILIAIRSSLDRMKSSNLTAFLIAARLIESGFSISPKLSSTHLFSIKGYLLFSYLFALSLSLSLIEASIKRIEIWALNSNLISCYCYCCTYEVEDDDDTHSPSPNSSTFRSWFLSLSLSLPQSINEWLWVWWNDFEKKRMDGGSI